MNILNKTIKYGTLLFVFLIPYQARWILVPGEINKGYWEYGTQSLYLTEILLFIVLIALVAKGAIYIRQTRPKFNSNKLYSPLGALILLVAWSGLSILWSIDKSVALEHWAVLIQAIVLLIVISSGAISFKKLSWAIILSATVQAILAFIEFRLQMVPGSTFFGMASQNAGILGTSVIETANGRWLRAYGSFPHPNILGAWLVLGIVVLIEKYKIQSTKYKELLYIPFAIILIGLLVTFSRSAWLATISYLVIQTSYLFLIGQKKLFLKLFVVGILFATTFIALYPDPFIERLRSNSRLEVMSNTERVAGFSQSWEIIKKYPMLGVGIGSYGLAVHQDLDNSQPSYFYQPVHNVGLLIFSELGVVGVLLIALFICLSLRLPAEVEGGSVFTTVAIPSITVLVPIIVLVIFDHYFWSLYSGMMISAIYIGILIVLFKKNT